MASTLTDDPALAPDAQRLLLAHSTISAGPRLRPVIAGIFSADTVETLRPDADVVEVLPHDGRQLIERVDPDLILVETGAFDAGRPWAFSGDPAAADRGRRLLGIVEAAHTQGRPVVLWWSGATSQAPSMIGFESRVDLVVRTDAARSAPRAGGDPTLPWSAGVQPGRFNSVGMPAERTIRPVYAGRWDRAAPIATRTRTEAVLRSAVAGGLEIWCDEDDPAGGAAFPGTLGDLADRRVPPAFAAEAYRSNVVFLAEPPHRGDPTRTVGDRGLAQLASGARLVGPDLSETDPALAEHVVPIGAVDDDAGAIRAAIGRGAPTPDQMRRLNRRLFTEYATDSALSQLLAYVGLTRSRASWRTICVVARIQSDPDVARLIDDVMRQRHQPIEAVLVAQDAHLAETAARELDRMGVMRVRTPPSTTPVTLRQAAGQAQAGWVWSWSAGSSVDRDYLLDLVIAGRTSGATAVGPIHGSADGFVADLPVAGALIAREPGARLPDPTGSTLADWARLGVPLYGVARDGAGSAA